MQRQIFRSSLRLTNTTGDNQRNNDQGQDLALQRLVHANVLNQQNDAQNDDADVQGVNDDPNAERGVCEEDLFEGADLWDMATNQLDLNRYYTFLKNLENGVIKYQLFFVFNTYVQTLSP